MQEPQRRHFPRFPIAHIAGTLQHAGDLKVLDLSQTGMRIETTSEIAAEEDRELELSYRRQSVRLRVHVRWVQRHASGAGEGGEVHLAGLTFRKVLSKERTGLWDWILVEG